MTTAQKAIKVTIEVIAQDWRGVRLALRQAYARDLTGPITHGPRGQYRYHLQVVDEKRVTTKILPPLTP